MNTDFLCVNYPLLQAMSLGLSDQTEDKSFFRQDIRKLPLGMKQEVTSDGQSFDHFMCMKRPELDSNIVSRCKKIMPVQEKPDFSVSWWIVS